MDVNLPRKCTALLWWLTCRRAVRFWVPAIGTVVIVLGGVPVAHADIELGHQGTVGRHRLADVYDSPGAVCDIVLPGPDSLGEVWMRVNPPVMYARDRTSGLDEQPVGWRATISALDEGTGAWRVVRQSNTARAVASDDLATYFNGEGWLTGFPVDRATYTATVEMLWYDPVDPDRVVGKATHTVEHYSVVLRYRGDAMNGRTSSSCSAPH
jgi:hypothetical protein